MALQTPTPAYGHSVLADASTDARYFGADPAVRLVFDCWPRNVEPDEVLVKVVVLNRLYSTNIYDVYGVRDHIISKSVDTRLAAGDRTLVNELADYRRGGKPRWIISFASKFCAWHCPTRFQIFDSYVEWTLWEYNERYEFSTFGRFDLRDYIKYVTVLDHFRERFHLEHFSRKDIDKFLWIMAKTGSNS